MKKETTVFIILDAFRWDYINPEDTPLLNEWSHNSLYAKTLISSAGFTQRSAIFCGTPSDVTNNFTMFSYDPDNSPFRFLNMYKPFLRPVQAYLNRKIPEREQMERKLRDEVIYPRTKKYAAHAPTAWIPLHLLPLIGITEDEKIIFDKGGMSTESIFDILHDKGVPFEYLMFPVTNCEDNNVLESTLNAAEKGSLFYLLQFSDSDLLMHHYGTSGKERRDVAREIDRKISLLRDEFDKNFERVNWLIIGDHGMTDIHTNLDVEEIIIQEGTKRGLTHGKDFLIFLDSTMARLWALKPRAQEFIDQIFNHPKLENSGTVIDQTFAKKNRIPFRNKKYGDVIWWANPGVLIVPDYFHPRNYIVKGMHGYDSHHCDMKGFAMLYTPRVKAQQIEQVNLIDICPTLCDLLFVGYPHKNEGISFMKELG